MKKTKGKKTAGFLLQLQLSNSICNIHMLKLKKFVQLPRPSTLKLIHTTNYLQCALKRSQTVESVVYVRCRSLPHIQNNTVKTDKKKHTTKTNSTFPLKHVEAMDWFYALLHTRYTNDIEFVLVKFISTRRFRSIALHPMRMSCRTRMLYKL